MRRRFCHGRYLAALFCASLLLSGCGTGNPAESNQAGAQGEQTGSETSAPEQEELSADSTELLKVVTAEFIDSAEQKEDRHLITIDISAFDRSAEDYEKWAQETYSNEATLVIVFTDPGEVFQSTDAAEDFMAQNEYVDYQSLSSGCDWTAIKIKRLAEDETKQDSEVLSVDIAYPILSGGKGLEVQMQMIDGEWEVARFKMIYVK